MIDDKKILQQKALYPHYSNKYGDAKGIFARFIQRQQWINGYLKDGSYEEQLVQCGVIKPKDVTEPEIHDDV